MAYMNIIFMLIQKYKNVGWVENGFLNIFNLSLGTLNHPTELTLISSLLCLALNNWVGKCPALANIG